MCIRDRLTHGEATEKALKLSAPLNDLISGKKLKLDSKQLNAYGQEVTGYLEHVVEKLKAQTIAFPDDAGLKRAYKDAADKYTQALAGFEAAGSEAGRAVEQLKRFGTTSRVPGMDGKIDQVRNSIKKFVEENPDKPEMVAEFDLSLIHISEPTRPY